MVPAIADALGFTFYGPSEPKAQLLNYLRDKQLQLVLDNVEHLLDGAGLVTEILHCAPDVKLLVTSREQLNVQEEWVFEVMGLLTLEEQQVLQRLSVFRGGFTREAAEQVAGATLGVLSTLVAKSLLHRTANGRYDLHELVRQYMGRQLMEVPSDYDATCARFSHYYADWLQRQEAPLFSAEQRIVLERVSAELDNVRAALTWAATQQAWASLDQSLDMLYWFYNMRNWYEDAITTLDQWITAASSARLVPDGRERWILCPLCWHTRSRAMRLT
jgi:predicted ATPase